MSRPDRPATYADIQALPENIVGEIIDGVLYTHPRPAIPHAHASSVLGADLGGPFHRGRGGPGGWVILFEPELHFVEDVVVPDMAGWRRERMPEVPKTAYLTLPPDWLCEVLSESTERVDRSKKLRIYARQGVGHVWLVNPVERFLEVLRLDGETYRIIDVVEEDARFRAEPFDAIELELGALWAR